MTTPIKTVLTAFGLAAILALPHAARADDYCREYQRSVVIGGVTQQAYGTACQGPDGQWRIASENLGAPPAPAPVVVQQPAYYPAQAYSPQNQVIVVDRGPYYGPRYYDGDGWYPDYYPAPVAVGIGIGFGHGYHGGYRGGYPGGYYGGGYHHWH